MLEQSLSRWEITYAQLRVLNALATGLDSHKKTRPKDLAHILDIDMAASTRLLDRLEKKGMITREKCTEDKRVCFIKLNNNFKREFNEIIEHQKRVENAFFQNISKKDKETFLKVTNLLSKEKKYRTGETGLSVIF